MSDKQVRKAKRWRDHHKDIVLPDINGLGKERVEMIAFKHQLNDDFPIEFGKEDSRRNFLKQ